MFYAARQAAKSTTSQLRIKYIDRAYNGSGLSLTVPSSIQEGDLAVAYSSTATGPSPTVYSGFTQITSLNSTFEDMFQYKIMTASDLGATFTRTNDNYDVAMMLFFRADTGSFSTVSVTDINNAGQTSSKPASQTVDEESPSLYIFVSGAYSSSAGNYVNFTSDGLNVQQFANYRQIGENGNQIRFYYILNNSVSKPVVGEVQSDNGSYNRFMSCAFTFS